MFKKKEMEELIQINDVFSYSLDKWRLIKNDEGNLTLHYQGGSYIYIDENSLGDLVKLVDAFIKLREKQKEDLK